MRVNLFTKESEIVEVIEANEPAILLMYKCSYLTTNDVFLSLPRSIVEVIQDYEDVFLEILSEGLPPFRGTEHQIHFIPGASIPNYLPYCRNPKETK